MAGIAALFAAALLLLAPAKVLAATFPITESFRNTTMQPGWNLGGNASLTANSGDGNGNGWLRLTGAVNNQFGVANLNDAFPSNNGVLAEFEYAAWGGTGADGLVFFLYDGSVAQGSFSTGPVGGSIGYTNCPQTNTPGLSGAYIGVGFDEWGNFFNSTFCNQNGGEVGGPGALFPNRVGVRGGTPTYPYLGSVVTSQSLQAPRASSRKVKVAITTDMKLSVYITYPNGQIQTVISEQQLPAAPSTLKLGFVSATGGSNNNHEVRNTQVVLPADLRATLTDGDAGAPRTGQRTYTATVTNDGPNPVVDATVKLSGATGITPQSWTCVAAGGGSCDASSGSGLPDTTADLPVGASATYTVVADVAAGADDASLTLTAGQTPGGQTGESDPRNNTVTDQTDLTPVNDVAPVATLAANGTASVTGGTWRGGHIARSYQWQRCDLDGTNCADIASATAASYALTASDAGKGVRAVVTADNAAPATGSEPSNLLLPPDTTIDSGPTASSTTTDRTPDFTFSSTPGGATFTCRVDGGAWAACTSTHTTASLIDGTHTFEVRATRNGHTDGTPASRTFDVDATAPTTTIDSGPADPTNATGATFDLSTDDPQATYECSLDGAPFAACVDGETLSGLAEGPHTFQVRAVDPFTNTDATPASYTWTVDTTPPADPAVDVEPPAHTNAPDAHFELTVDNGATLWCKVDGGAWATCATPFDLPSIAVGTHTVQFRARDAAGNDSGVVQRTFEVDRTTSVDLTAPAPGRIANAKPTVTLTGEPGATLVLKDGATTIAGGVFANDGKLSLPLVAALAEGAHTLVATSTDLAGNTATDQVTITVDTIAPDVVVLGERPASPSNTGTSTFTWTGPEAGATYKCKLDGGAWGPCTSPFTLSGLGEGPHTFSVVAIDETGNEGPRVDHTWTVDKTPPPAPTPVERPEPRSPSTDAVIDVSHEPGAVLVCKVDDGPYQPCVLPLKLTGLKKGGHVVQVRQVDLAGNLGAPAIVVWEAGHETPKPPATKPATKVTPAIASRATVEDGRNVKVGCSLDQPVLQSCTVKAYVKGKLVGTGVRKVGADGRSAGAVQVKLNATGRKMLQQAVGGLEVRLEVKAKGRGQGQVLTETASATLHAQRTKILPQLDPFDFDRAKLTARSKRTLRGLVRELRGAKRVVCVGHTDKTGAPAYNLLLGLKRAKAACAQLKDAGLKAQTRITTMGETRPRATNATEAGRRLNRRIELLISY
ncbi:Ig-like domain-containing protein [Conexibacter sp. SYSU D00693]|uniref:Ig-like domain-containing protein n=1 Tax=Conexibacter sp. SYSU D00693 TaxID=2812560 RepID=UPI00196A75B0|nr:Ig-like domain-containing protein [Conexibacter sp. SYSU D00693]